jgi:hypothetical protein
VYHLTAASNLPMIQHDRRLYPAANLMEMSGRTELMHRKRTKHEPVMIRGLQISIRDQKVLHPGNMSLPRGYSFEAFVESLNRRVFFWPGTAAEPIDYGVRHYERYTSEAPIILRIPTARLFAANLGVAPLYCRYNSGSPRCSRGKKIPRGPNIFVSSDDFDYPPGRVVEVTFEASVRLPAETEWGPSPFGPWQALA